MPAQRHAQRVQIADVAAHLGVTKSTVSRALNGYTDISDATRQRVMRAAETLGYQPLSHAQAIRTGRVRSMGLILEMHEHDGHRPFVAEFLAGLSEAASRAAWTLTVATVTSDADTRRLLADLADQRKADGFILPRTKLRDARVDFLRKREIPFVLYGRVAEPDGCAWFDIESEAAMEEAVLRLAALGHGRIGYIGGAEGYTYARLRHEGYVAGLRAAGLEMDARVSSGSAVTREAGAAEAKALLAQGVTAIVCAVDQAALGVFDAAAEQGLEIGRDVSVISYDGIPEGKMMQPRLSSFQVDVREAGGRLAQTLIRLCGGEAPEDLRALGRARFVEGGSHGAAP